MLNLQVNSVEQYQTFQGHFQAKTWVPKWTLSLGSLWYLRTSFALCVFHQIVDFSTKSSHNWIIVLRATSEFELPRSGRRKRENNNKKLWTCSTIFGRFLCSHHTTIVVKLNRNDNPIPVPVGSSNQCSLLQSYIVDNYSVNQCNETNRVHLFACSIETFNSSDILVNLYATGREKKEDDKPCVTSVTIILFEITFRQNSLSFKQIFL